MGSKKLRIINTETDNLVSNLRGEIAEVVTTWMLMRHFMASAASLQTDDVTKDFGNPDLAFRYVLRDKLEDELVARLSELAEEKIGRLNFFFAAEKLGRLHQETADFSGKTDFERSETKTSATRNCRRNGSTNELHCTSRIAQFCTPLRVLSGL
jgi:hypothetical protein